MNFNFFDWIRDGVKRSVLMGVSDAVEQMGAPPDEDASKDKILAFLQSDETKKVAGTNARRRLAGGGGNAPVRKLGRSIADIHQE
jgi:hypothetical protein